MLEGNYKQNIVYTYSTEHLIHKDKVLFFYAIKGRNGKTGVFARLSIKQLGRCVLLAPVESEPELDAFFQKWNCAFTKQSVLVASRCW